ncbi:MAG: glycine--tRNA ligase [Gemmatimonadota bacterium]|nr:glycine--tRNA ligase [Gemmatimonadota bacterium]
MSENESGHPSDLMNKLVSLSKRRGFIFQSSEIYGGVGSVYDYGPLGIELKNKIQQHWWREMVYRHDNIVGVDAGILMNPEVWVASGHVGAFSDPLVECTNCHRRFRADELADIEAGNADEQQCPSCGTRGNWTEPRQFDLMFKTFMGVVQDDKATVYLRPETAQGIFVNFKNVQDSARQKVPFGIAQVGKAFRNEITPGNFIFRTREFEQMEMQYFVKPGSEDEHFEAWMERRMDWVKSLGIREDRLRLHEHGPDELAHYCKRAFDIEYRFPFGWQEFEGIHNRTDYDLGNHQEHSGKKLEYFDPASQERYVPYVVETSAGLSRTLLVVLADAYDEEELENETRIVLRLSPKLAPIQAAVFPLVKKDGMPEISEKLAADLRGQFNVQHDVAGSIGKRYRRQDEAGTPFCLTIDGETLENGSVTVRDRDTLAQERVSLDSVAAYLADAIHKA